MELHIDDILRLRELNHRAGWLVSDYINDMPRAITCELISEIMENPSPETESVVYRALLAGFMGLDRDNIEDREIEDVFLTQGVRCLDPETFLDNPYYRNIKIPDSGEGEWRLLWQEYEPYEAFIRDDLIIDRDGREIPAIGYFRESFKFPSVVQNGREWMSIKPSEIITSQAAVDASSGRVLTFGLGLGYFAYMALLKDDVSHVTVVELDENVIDLFNKHILPQFPRQEDITIVHSDAFDFLDKGLDVDFVFMDIWHDIADGTELYVRAKQYENRYPEVRFSYWAERSLRCALADGLFSLH